ncbi:MAG: hypothetical protein ACRC2T_05500 [Thermoguttaceae bacterium]
MKQSNLRNFGKASVFASKEGLFTIVVTGDGAIITNPDGFEPNTF